MRKAHLVHLVPQDSRTGVMAAGHAERPLLVHWTRYDVALFEPSMFDDSGIGCPAHIVRSVHKRQAEYYHGRLCAFRALAAIGINAYTVHTGMHREPLWPSGVIGSIAHNDEYAAAAIASKVNGSMVGLDIERVVEDEAQEALRSIVVSAGELCYLRSLSLTFTLGAALTLVFSAKEAFFKACFPEVGRYFDFDAVTVTLIDPTLKYVELRLNQTLSGRLAAGQEYRVDYYLLNEKTFFTVLYR